MPNTSQIKEHMDVISSDRKTVGKVDHLEGTDKIKLTKQSSPDGQHRHFIPLILDKSRRPARAPEQDRRRCNGTLAARRTRLGIPTAARSENGSTKFR